ncbi:unnamed protein product, partial [Discosporangium mesarthrocarpum]
MGNKASNIVSREGREAIERFHEVELRVIMMTYKELASVSQGGGEGIDKETFLQYFPVPGLVGERLFHVIDHKNSGKISFEDFTVGLAVCCRGTLQEKMRFIFSVYDIGGDGHISREELLLMLNQVPGPLLSFGAASLAQGGAGGDDNGSRQGTAVSEVSGGEGTDRRGGEGGGRGGDGGVARGEDGVREPHCAGVGVKGGGCGGAGAEGGPLSPGAREQAASEFTREDLVDAAFRDFGSDKGEPLTFHQFERWAQHTPAVQALLQGAFPTDSHFSLATSPRARAASCDSIADPAVCGRHHPSPSTPSRWALASSGPAPSPTALRARQRTNISAPSSRRGTPKHRSPRGGGRGGFPGFFAPGA